MMNYLHRFQVRAPLAAVAEFHRQAASMAAITPPPIVVRVHTAPARLNEGEVMDFTLWLGPLPIRWVARFEQVSLTGFVDRQVAGPFRSWVHRHSFVALDAATTEVRDEIKAELSPAWWWRLVGLGMWLNLPVLFAYRGWQTRRLLQRKAVWNILL